jgi:hypothetical protein
LVSLEGVNRQSVDGDLLATVDSVIVATIPVIPVMVGVAEVVVMAGHRVAQGPVQALTPEFAVSLSHT